MGVCPACPLHSSDLYGSILCVWFSLSMLSLLPLPISTDTYLHSRSCLELQIWISYKHMSKMEICSFLLKRGNGGMAGALSPHQHCHTGWVGGWASPFHSCPLPFPLAPSLFKKKKKIRQVTLTLSLFPYMQNRNDDTGLKDL